jgi:predicted transposase/invertase (TIGR01784 family)
MTDKPHNNFFVLVFSDKEIMTDLITQLLPEVNAKIDVSTIELESTTYIDQKLDDLYSDIVYSCKSRTTGRQVKITLLFEHKSYPVSYPRFQLLDYITGIWRQNLQNGEKLSLVIPIIFYHGKTRWKYQTFESYFKDIEDSLKSYIPDFQYHVIDLENYSDEEILALRVSFLINALIAMKHKSEPEYISKHPGRVFFNLEQYANDERGELLTNILMTYLMLSNNILLKDIHEIYAEFKRERKENEPKSEFENLYEGLQIQAEKRGLEKGLEKGLERGLEGGFEKRNIDTAIEMIYLNLDKDIIHRITKIPMVVIDQLKLNVGLTFNAKEAKLNLARLLEVHFKHLVLDDIVQICQLSIEETKEF